MRLQIKLVVFTLSCDVAIITAVADVNPTVTGNDIKSTSAPNDNIYYKFNNF